MRTWFTFVNDVLGGVLLLHNEVDVRREDTQVYGHDESDGV